MEEQNNRLADLLNDETFLRWLRDDAPKEEKAKWEEWLSSDSDRETLVKKAEKIISMPFREWDDAIAKSQQLEELMKSLEESGNLKLLKDDN